jgi:DNA-binding response OmpR family regulator
LRQKSHILVVESDDLIRQLLERWLGEAGYAVISAGSGPPALERVPRLVIANVSSPRNAAELIRSLQVEHAAPILVVSARFRRGLGSSVEAAHRLGVCKLLPKPFTREELLAAVGDLIGGP